VEANRGFLYEFVNDANDFVYISLLLVLVGIFIFFLQIMRKKLSAPVVRRPPAVPSAPPMPSPSLFPLNVYEQTYEVHNEIIKKNNITKEIGTYTGHICKACGLKA